MKVAFLLRNMQRFSEKFNIITQDHHKLWEIDNFEFPSEERLINIVYNNEMELMEKIMTELQKNVMNVDINDKTLLDDDGQLVNNNEYSSEDDFPDYKMSSNKRKRKTNRNRITDINEIRDINKLDDIYETQNIIKHKVGNDTYYFLVKWKGYDDKNSSWTPITSFSEKDLLKESLNEKQILYKL